MPDTPLDQLKQRTTKRLESTKAKTKYCDDLELGKERHFESRFKRVVEDERVAICVYIKKELAEALDEDCGPVIPGRKRVCRAISRAYMVELILHRYYVNPRAKWLPDDPRSKKYKACA